MWLSFIVKINCAYCDCLEKRIRMSYIVDEMLERISKEGYSPDELKEAVISALFPFFDNTEVLNVHAMSSDFLTIFSFIILYHSEIFSKQLLELLKCYRKAYLKNPNKVKSVILSTANLIGQKENIMCTVKSNTPKNISGDMYEITYSLMKHIGDVLEISAKHEITELYAILEISLDNDKDYEEIKKRKFGVIVQNILDKNYFEDILKNLPNNIKLSDWRNIAYHHEYKFSDDKIICYYGKKRNCFEITVDDLYKYTGAIMKSCNIIDIARKIFLLEHADFFSELNIDDMVMFERDVMKIGKLRTALLGQGFKLINEKINCEYEEIILEDLELGDLTSDDTRNRRQIHCTQFLFNIWLEFPSKKICIIHTNNSGRKLYSYSIDGEICENISKDLIKFENMFKYVTIEKL